MVAASEARLHIDEEIYKIARYNVENLIFENRLKAYIGKYKDLWQAIKSYGLPNKSGGCIVGTLAENQLVKYDTKSILKTVKFFFKFAGRFIGNTSEAGKSIYN